MSGTPEVIELLTDVNGSFIHEERISASDTAIKPGYLVEETGGEVQEHSAAGANAQKLFALTNISNGGTIDDVYTVGETVRYGAAHSGQKAYGLVAAGAAAIADGVALESAGDGTLRVLTTAAATSDQQRNSIVAWATEAVDNSGGGTEARIEIRVA